MAEFKVEPLPSSPGGESIPQPAVTGSFFNVTTLKYIFGILVILLAISSFVFFFRQSSFSESNIKYSRASQ